MDYLEGALLGPLWSDTDFENTPHRGAALWLSVAFWVIGVRLVLSANSGRLNLFSSSPVLWGVVLFVLLLASPVLSYIYYDLPVAARPAILALQVLKFSSAWFLIYSVFVPRMIIGDQNLIDYFMRRSDGIASNLLGSSFFSSATGLVFGFILLGLMFLLAFIIGILFFLFFPTLILRLTILFQKLIDQMFLRLTVNQRKQIKQKDGKKTLFADREETQESTEEAIEESAAEQVIARRVTLNPGTRPRITR